VPDAPATRFTKLGEDRIAYQVLGDSPLDLIYAGAGLANSVDVQWEWPPLASFLHRLASFSRLIMFDRRGVGASDPVSSDALPIMEEWADDARAVLDAVGSERAAIFGTADAGPSAILFAASQPERTEALILANTSARVLVDHDYPWGYAEAELDDVATSIAEMWGTEALVDFACPDNAADPALRQWFAKEQRASCSPREAAGFNRVMEHTDVRAALSLVAAPTLVLQRRDTAWLTVDHSRYLAEHIAGAQLAVVPGRDHTVFTEPNEEILDHIEHFLTRALPSADSDRALAAILFTDIVGSTEKAVALGDRDWRNLLESHDAVARALVGQHRGRLVKMTGDGVLATFDGPGRAIRCAIALRDALEPLGIAIRAGLHTGEVELRVDDIGGIGVHIAARVLERAAGGELLVSAAVPLLVAGSGIAFEDRGEHELKGVGALRLYAVENA